MLSDDITQNGKLSLVMKLDCKYSKHNRPTGDLG